mmetsp:Transcript_25098/g.54635  ORF Transcript_25098/g.54635 Transcript_25098/m.54635 type:complete len:298 (+) Transcript_25098:330-1223(+)
MLNDLLEAASNQGVLLENLVDVWSLHKLQRLCTTIRQVVSRAHHCLSLMGTITQREHILALFRVLQGSAAIDTLDLNIEGSQLPVQGCGGSGTLVGCSGRNDPHVLEERQERRKELLAAEFDPATLSIGDEHNSAVSFGHSKGLGNQGSNLGQALTLPGVNLGTVIQPETLTLHPAGRKYSIVPIENKESFLLAVDHIPSLFGRRCGLCRGLRKCVGSRGSSVLRPLLNRRPLVRSESLVLIVVVKSRAELRCSGHRGGICRGIVVAEVIATVPLRHCGCRCSLFRVVLELLVGRLP